MMSFLNSKTKIPLAVPEGIYGSPANPKAASRKTSMIPVCANEMAMHAATWPPAMNNGRLKEIKRPDIHRITGNRMIQAKKLVISNNQARHASIGCPSNCLSSIRLVALTIV